MGFYMSFPIDSTVVRNVAYSSGYRDAQPSQCSHDTVTWARYASGMRLLNGKPFLIAVSAAGALFPVSLQAAAGNAFGSLDQVIFVASPEPVTFFLGGGFLFLIARIGLKRYRGERR